jgi:hypothetical protein
VLIAAFQKNTRISGFCSLDYIYTANSYVTSPVTRFYNGWTRFWLQGKKRDFGAFCVHLCALCVSIRRSSKGFYWRWWKIHRQEDGLGVRDYSLSFRWRFFEWSGDVFFVYSVADSYNRSRGSRSARLLDLRPSSVSCSSVVKYWLSAHENSESGILFIAFDWRFGVLFLLIKVSNNCWTSKDHVTLLFVKLFVISLVLLFLPLELWNHIISSVEVRIFPICWLSLRPPFEHLWSSS